jgi:hypothetical protein
MTKFEEMCQARNQCAKAWAEYRNRSYANLIALVQGFSSRCQIPLDCLSFAPLDKEIEPGAIYGPAGAIHFDNTDCYWRLGMILTLRESPHTFPQTRVLLELALKEQAGKTLVKRGKDDTPREIDLSNQTHCDELYDSIADRVKEFYSVGPENLSDDTKLRKIGFIAG